MTSYEFEKAAKNAVIKVLNENISISELDLVWFAHELGYKKCTVWGQPMGDRYAEVTYNRDKDEMYVDIYKKISNTKIQREEFDMEAWWLDDYINYICTSGVYYVGNAESEEVKSR